MTKLEPATSFKPYVLFPEKKERASLCISSMGDYLSEILGDLQHWNNIFDFSAIDSKNSHASKSSDNPTRNFFGIDIVGIYYPPFITSADISRCFKNLILSKDGSTKFESLLKDWVLHHKYYLIDVIILDSALLFIAATDCYGVQSVVKLIENAKNSHYISDMLASSFKENVLEILMHPVASQIVACCLQNLGYEHNKFLFKAALKHCVKLAKNRFGNESLKQIILGSANYERADILLKIADNSVYLAKHPKGNHVIQFALEVLDDLPFNEYLCRCLEEHLLELAVDQYGSYVIQKCMQSFGGELLIESLVRQFDLSKFERLATDAYGNYVFQTAIEKSKGTWLQYELVEALRQLPKELSTHAYASNVFKFLRRHDRNFED